MACGQCSCGGKHSHQPESRGSSRFNALIGVAAGVLVLGVVGLAVALEPPADKPAAPDKPRAAAPAGEPEASPRRPPSNRFRRRCSRTRSSGSMAPRRT